jgi:hypothetical protein
MRCVLCGGDDVETDKGYRYFVAGWRGLWSWDRYCVAEGESNTTRRKCQQSNGSANKRRRAGFSGRNNSLAGGGAVGRNGWHGAGIGDVPRVCAAPHSSSVDGRVAGPTLRAVDEETVHLVVLGVQQDRSTVSAQIVNGVRAGSENGRCIHNIFDAPGFHHSQCSLWSFHVAPLRALARIFAPMKKKGRTQ